MPQCDFAKTAFDSCFTIFFDKCAGRHLPTPGRIARSDLPPAKFSKSFNPEISKIIQIHIPSPPVHPPASTRVLLEAFSFQIFLTVSQILTFSKTPKNTYLPSAEPHLQINNSTKTIKTQCDVCDSFSKHWVIFRRHFCKYYYRGTVTITISTYQTSTGLIKYYWAINAVIKSLTDG
jgi:hypothetical protein